MNNQKQCFYCGTGTKYKPITNKKGEIISLHSICRNPNCSVNLTMLALKRRKSTLNSKKRTVSGRRRNRLVPGLLVGIVSAATSFFGFTALANSDGLKNEVSYQSPQTTISTSTPPSVPETKPEPVLQSKEEIRDYVLSQASSTGVWVAKIDHMVEHESHYDPKAIGDMQLICQYGKNKGKPVRARGIWQITDCGHPEITDEQAFDVKWSTAWALSIISKSQKDCRTQWTTCDGWYKI